MLGFCTLVSASSLDAVITSRDKTRLSELFEAAQPYESMETPYHIVTGLHGLGFDESNKMMRKNACTMANVREYTELKDIFYSTSISAILGDCSVGITFPTEVASVLAVACMNPRERGRGWLG